MEEKTIKERLAALTEPEEEDERSKGKGKGKTKASASSSGSGGGKGRRGQEEEDDADEEEGGLVKYLPAAHREAVRALVEAAEGKRARPSVRGHLHLFCFVGCGLVFYIR